MKEYLLIELGVVGNHVSLSLFGVPVFPENEKYSFAQMISSVEDNNEMSCNT
jgi:hypothetical protein